MEWNKKAFIEQIKLAGSGYTQIEKRAKRNLDSLRSNDPVLYEKLYSDMKKERDGYTLQQRRKADW